MYENKEIKVRRRTQSTNDPLEFHIGNSTYLLVMMGRHRLYNTPEEKKAAKAAKSKRSYERFVIL